MSFCNVEGCPGTFAGIFEGHLWTGERQHACIDQRVVQDDVGLGKTRDRIKRQQAGIARTCADEPDVARLEDRILAVQRRQCIELFHNRSPRNLRR